MRTKRLRLSLARETLRSLDKDGLMFARGATGTAAVCTRTTPQTTCGMFCNTYVCTVGGCNTTGTSIGATCAGMTCGNTCGATC